MKILNIDNNNAYLFNQIFNEQSKKGENIIMKFASKNCPYCIDMELEWKRLEKKR